MGASWVGITEHQARVTLPTVEEPLTVTVDEEGALQSVETLRIDGDSGELRPFGAFVESEWTVNGMTIPWKVEVGWDIGMDEYEPFFRGELQQVTFF